MRAPWLPLLLAACSAEAPPVAVASAPPPARPSAAASAAPPEDPEPPREDPRVKCEAEADEVFQEERLTLEACDDLVAKLTEIALRCDENPRSTLHLRNGAYERCVDKQAERALEGRLAQLAGDKGALDHEKKAQAALETATPSVCCHTDGDHSESLCNASFARQRAAWLLAANRGELEIGDKDPSPKDVKAAKAAIPAPWRAFEPFAKELCAAPKGVWKGKKTPKGCTDRVLLALAPPIQAAATRWGACP